ncbi:MAG: hypothetical protein LBC67_05550, partial [Spirochaetales bacterium]|nr:hypothetical protein [Spirochaetales bacterium]
MKLRLRLTLIMTVMLLVVVGTTAGVLLSRATSLQTAAAWENMKNLTAFHAYEVRSDYVKSITAALSLARVLDAYEKFPEAIRRKTFGDLLESLLESSPEFVGVFTVWKPGRIDSLAAQYAGSPGSDAEGNYINWYMYEDGRVKLKPFRDAASFLENMPDVPTVSDPRKTSVNG